MEDFKKLLESGKLLIGTNEVTKALRLGKLTKVMMAKNAKVAVQKDVTYYAKLAQVEVEVLDISNEQLGKQCKKPFFVSLLGITK